MAHAYKGLLRRAATSVRLCAIALAFLGIASTASAQAAPVVSTGGFQSFGGAAGSNNVSLCLDVLNWGSRAPVPGTRLDSYYCMPNDQGQIFTLVNDRVGGGQQLRAAVGSNLCLAAPGRLSSGAPVALESCTGTGSQNWQFIDGLIRWSGDPSYCLDVNSANMSPSTPVDVAPCNETVAQLWLPWGYTLNIESKVPSLPGLNALCLDDYGDEHVEGGRVDSATCNGTAAQVWQYQKGTDVLMNVNGQTMQVQPWTDFFGPGTVDLIDAEDLDYTGNEWLLGYSPSSTLGAEFVNGATGDNFWVQCLDVYGANPAPNTTVDSAICNSTNAQLWQVTLTG